MFSGVRRNFSEQYAMNCQNNPNSNCETGGTWPPIWNEIKNSDFVALMEDQEYQAADNLPCDRTTPNGLVLDEPSPTGLTGGLTIGDYNVLRKLDKEERMLDYLTTHGPVIVAISANDTLYYYGSGVIDYCMGGQKTLDHSVLMVGYDPNVLVMKNSWGTDWGEDGFFRVARGCGPSHLGYSYWASVLSVVSLQPITIETGYEAFQFTQISSSIPQWLSLPGVEVKKGDLILLKVMNSANPQKFKFIIELLNVDGDKISTAYRLVYVKENGEFFCKQLEKPENREVEICTLPPKGIIKISVCKEGYSVIIGGTSLKPFSHKLDFTLVNKIEIKVVQADSKPLFEFFKLRRVKGSCATNTTSTGAGNVDVDIFQFTRRSSKIPQWLAVPDVEVKIGDLLTLKVLKIANPKHFNFALDLLNFNKNRKTRVYRLEYANRRGRFLCRQLENSRNQLVESCTLPRQGVIKISVCETGYSVVFGGTLLKSYPHLIEVDMVEKIEIRVSKDDPELNDAEELFKFFKLSREKGSCPKAITTGAESDGEETFQFALKKSSGIPQWLSVPDPELKEGDLLILTVLQYANPTNFNFTLDLLNVDGDSENKAYRLHYVDYADADGFVCRQLEKSENQEVESCTLPRQGVIKISVCKEGYSVIIGGTSLKPFSHKLDVSLVNKIEVNVLNDDLEILFEFFRIRRGKGICDLS